MSQQYGNLKKKPVGRMIVYGMLSGGLYAALLLNQGTSRRSSPEGHGMPLSDCDSVRYLVYTWRVHELFLVGIGSGSDEKGSAHKDRGKEARI